MAKSFRWLRGPMAVRAFAAVVVALAATALGVSSHWWRAPVAGSDDEAGSAWPAANRSGDAAALPKAVCDRPEHDLGTVDLADKIEHTFLVRNEGSGPLLLRRGGTSCTCAMSDLPQGEIPPGCAAQVRVGLKSGEKAGSFSQWAKVLTNDPDQPVLLLKIRGTIRAHLAAEPPQIVFTALRPGESPSARLLVYSQVWPEFKLEVPKVSRADLKWRLEPAEPEALASRGACAGYWCEVSLPPVADRGSVAEWLEFAATSGESLGAARALRVSVNGNVVGRLTVSGDRLDALGTLHVGSLRPGQGARERLTLKVRDELPDLVIRRIETKPEFLRVRVEPLTPDSARVGLYRIDVEVPADAPPCVYQGTSLGEIRIVTERPKQAEVRLKVAFAVASQ